MRIKHKLIIPWLPVGAWCVLIFVQSAFAAPDIGPDWPCLDKLAHLGIYGLLAVLLCRGLAAHARWQGRPLKLVMAATILTALYGLSDEWHQSFVPARTADVADWLADLTGGVLGCGAYLLIRKARSLRAGRHSFPVN